MKLVKTKFFIFFQKGTYSSSLIILFPKETTAYSMVLQYFFLSSYLSIKTLKAKIYHSVGITLLSLLKKFPYNFASLQIIAVRYFAIAMVRTLRKSSLIFCHNTLVTAF